MSDETRPAPKPYTAVVAKGDLTSAIWAAMLRRLAKDFGCRPEDLSEHEVRRFEGYAGVAQMVALAWLAEAGRLTEHAELFDRLLIEREKVEALRSERDSLSERTTQLGEELEDTRSELRTAWDLVETRRIERDEAWERLERLQEKLAEDDRIILDFNAETVRLRKIIRDIAPTHPDAWIQTADSGHFCAADCDCKPPAERGDG